MYGEGGTGMVRKVGGEYWLTKCGYVLLVVDTR